MQNPREDLPFKAYGRDGGVVAQFRSEHERKEYGEGLDLLHSQPANLIATLIRRASKREENYYLSGENPTDYGYNVGPYQDLIDALKAGIVELEFLLTHKHEWSENDYCIHCGSDGRA